MNQFLARFKIDNHHRIERFGVLFCFFVVFFSVLFGISIKKDIDRKKLRLSETALYTTRSQWSKTGQQVDIYNIYRNNDSSKVFILLKTYLEAATDSALISTNADDYEIFMTGYNGEKLTNNPKAAIYMFGSTGYFGLYFVDAKGFDPHMYDIIVRNNGDLTTQTSNSAAEFYENDDSSFMKFNQIHLYANLAGSDAVVKDFLNADNPTLEEIYADVISSIDEKEVRETLDASLITMNNYMNVANQYADRLTTLGIKVPNLPPALAGDSIVLDGSLANKNPTAFEKSMLNPVESVISSDYNGVENTSVGKFDCLPVRDVMKAVEYADAVKNGLVDEMKEKDEVTLKDYEKYNGKLYLVTDYVFPGGYQYNYQALRLMDKGLESLMPNGLSFRQWVEEKAIEVQTYRTISSKFNAESYYSTWYYLDGTKFKYDPDTSLDVDKAQYDAINAYTGAITDLYLEKYNYQTMYLYNLLKLEASANTSTSMFTINAKDDMFYLYEE